MKRNGRLKHRIIVGNAVLMLLVGAARAQLTNAPGPLDPPDTSSPRATIATVMSIANEAYALWKRGEGRTYHNLAERVAMAQRVSSCFDLNDIAPSLRANVAREAGVYLKEIFDRIELPTTDEIPDAAAIAKMPGGLPRWTIPHTEITLVRINDGLRAGQYVFSSDTDNRAREFYLRVEHLPYKPGATPGLYDVYSSEPGWMIPRSLIHILPGWMQARWGNQTVWQWLGMVLTLVVAAAAMVLIYRIGSRFSRHHSGLPYYLAIVFPIIAMLVPAAATYFLGHGVFLSGSTYTVIAFSLDLIALGALVVVILGIANRLATAVGALPWFRPRSVDAQLTQLVIRVCGVAGAVVAILEGGRYLGVPLTTLIASASVSGLAVALAAQDALKNLFGSLMILLDKPFVVGDTIKIKSYEGKVELIGLRSTKLRLGSGHVVTIANADLANSDSENISRRAHLRRSDTIRLKSDTPLEKIQQALEIVRAALQDQEGSDPNKPPAVHLTAIGPDAVTLAMTYWFQPPDTAKFAAFNERLNLTLLKQFQAAGIPLA